MQEKKQHIYTLQSTEMNNILVKYINFMKSNKNLFKLPFYRFFKVPNGNFRPI